MPLNDLKFSMRDNNSDPCDFILVFHRKSSQLEKNFDNASHQTDISSIEMGFAQLKMSISSNKVGFARLQFAVS